MLKPLIACLLFIVGIPLMARADVIPVVAETTSIPLGETRKFEFGTVPQADTTVLLRITSRLDSLDLGGSNYFLKIMLNGQEVQAARSRTATRLVNKPVVSPVAPNLPYTWFGAGAGWRVLYAPDFEKARAQKFYTDDPYTLVLDVTDLTNPAAANKLEITNLARTDTKQYAKTNADLIIQSLTIETKPGASPMMAPAVNVENFINTGQPAAGPSKYTAQIAPGGGLTVTIKGKTYEFSSAYSYPDAGFNMLTTGPKADDSGQKSWRVTTKNSQGGATAQAEGDDYKIARTIKQTPSHIEVADAITNKHDTALGLIVRHEMSLQGLNNSTIRLAGNPDPAVNEYFAPGNPSVYTTTPDGGLGMICEDDVFRNQAKLYTKPEGETPLMGLRTEMLRLAPHETYTVRWSVYPVAGPDYYDFLNLVRQDWGSNYRVDGAWYWGFYPPAILKMSDEEIRESFNRLGIRYTTVGGGWVNPEKDKKRIGFGADVLNPYWDDWRRQIREAADKMRKAVPGLKVVAYFDTQRDTEDKPEKYRDSWVTDEKGNQDYTDWNNIYSRSYSVVATQNNSFGKAVLETADRYMDEMKLDGIYWDEMENTGFATPEFTYNQPDGHSAILDPKTYRIQQEIGLTPLLGMTNRLAIIDHVKKKGGIVLGNGPTTNKPILHAQVQRMVEIQHNDIWSYQALLATPLGYMGGRMDFGNITRGINLGCLPVGTRMNYDYDMPRYLFPFTPIELHSGYLLGKERIVATHSGNYGWPDERTLVQVRHFNKDGKLTTTDFSTSLATGAHTAVKLSEGEAIVLERLPLSLAPAKADKNWKATVSQVRYDENGTSLKVSAPQGGILTVRNGRYALANNGSIPVKAGGSTMRNYKVANGAIKVNLPAGFDGEVQIGKF